MSDIQTWVHEASIAFSELTSRYVRVYREAEVTLMREALKRYGSHVGHCPRNLLRTEADYEQPCSCGFDAALNRSADPTNEGLAKPDNLKMGQRNNLETGATP